MFPSLLTIVYLLPFAWGFGPLSFCRTLCDSSLNRDFPQQILQEFHLFYPLLSLLNGNLARGNSRLFIFAHYFWYIIQFSSDLYCCFWEVSCQLKGHFFFFFLFIIQPSAYLVLRFSFCFDVLEFNEKYLDVYELLFKFLLFIWYPNGLLSHNLLKGLMSTGIAPILLYPKHSSEHPGMISLYPNKCHIVLVTKALWCILISRSLTNLC